MTVCLEPVQELTPENGKAVVVARPNYESELSRILDGGKQEYWRMTDRVDALEKYLDSRGQIADHKEALKYLTKLRSSSALEKQIGKGNVDGRRVNALMVRLDSYLYDERLRIAQESKAGELEAQVIEMEPVMVDSERSARIDYAPAEVVSAPKPVYEEPANLNGDVLAVRDRVSCLAQIDRRNEEVAERTGYQTFWRRAKNFVGSVFNPRRTKTDFKILTTILDGYTNRHPNPKALAFDIVADRIDGSKLKNKQVDRLVRYRRQLLGMERFEDDFSFREMVGRNVEKLDLILAKHFRFEGETSSFRQWLDRISIQPSFVYAR